MKKFNVAPARETNGTILSSTAEWAFRKLIARLLSNGLQETH